MTYKLTLTILGESWEQKGKTIEEALSKFPLEWQEIKGKGSLVVSQGTQKHEHLMTMKLLRRIFANKVTRSIWSRNLERLLGGDITLNPQKNARSKRKALPVHEVGEGDGETSLKDDV